MLQGGLVIAKSGRLELGDNINGQYIGLYSTTADEIANVNLFKDNIAHIRQNTIDSCINSARGRCYIATRRQVLKRKQ